MITHASVLGVNPRLNRIKLVSRVAKFICYLIFAYSSSLAFYRQWPPSWPPSFAHHDEGRIDLLIVISQIVVWFGYLRLARKPHFKDHSRLILLMVIFQFWLCIWYLIMFRETSLPGGVLQNMLMNLVPICIWIWYWKLARLFRHYERGRIFAAETICCIKTLGLLLVIGWLLGLAAEMMPDPALPPGAVVGGTVSQVYQMNFFSFDFGTGVNLGQFFIGIIIVLIAWIMDEGRKIQEEQELTV